ncbi:flagellar export protein FliJ [Fervidobacterium sp. SC_NGM5_O18]|uniref:Flagellar FliJ protein n=2 Tax=Fervidobacterium pennivorans TaxID=93466 RepID=A0A172T3Z8_FERPE|nr:flagellar export protein FliJ [Fervidobacterium pennivorans]AFG35949.1 flagellar export protein FliJ [Fervidobacterium pennivorans DSM 9078]ANE41684.1 flagellar export protein FliJ [Fervidobacterium pennivorans]PHJ13503.1 flagellar export protein FliJ [Fervidobacterium sp. SC_NGM5_O18]QIV79009.1 flagellar export protein FliJ [Fervidobacterium pennivorans subsp. keratinolyticus]
MSFRLEKLLSLRQKEEEALKNELSRIRAEIRKLEEEIEQVSNSKKITEEQLRSGVQTGAQVAFLIYLVQMYDEHLKKLKLKLSNIRKIEEETLRAYLEKRTERRSFEKLKERYVRAQLLEADRKERKIIDEVALQKYIKSLEGR